MVQKSFSTPPCQPRLQIKRKTTAHAFPSFLVTILCISNISHSIPARKLRGKKPNGLKYLNLSIPHKFEYSSLPTSISKHSKIHWVHNYKTHYHTIFTKYSMICDKTCAIGHANICDTFIISCNSNISYSVTCPKTWGKGTKRLKILEI